MEPKPAEKVIMITDPKEIAKYKRETDKSKQHGPVVPTVLSAHQQSAATETENHDHNYERKAENDHDQVKHRVKRDSGKPNEKRDNTKVQPLVNKPVHKPAAAVKSKVTPSQPPRKNEPAKHEPSRHEPARHEPAIHEPARHEPVRHEAVKHRQRRDVSYTVSSSTTAVPVDSEHKNENGLTHVNAPPAVDSIPSINKNENNEPHVNASENKHTGQEPQVRPQILPAFLPVGAEVNPHALPAVVTVKRDIPVPLVPKHKHPEESPKDDKTSEEDSDEESEEKKSEEKKPQKGTHEENKPADEHKIHDLKKEDVENLNGAVPLQHPKPISLEQQHNTKQDSEQLSQNLAHHHNNAFIHHEQQEHHFQPQHPHVASHQDEIIVQQKETNSAAVESTPSSTEHPVLRHKPVPVAELFAR